MNQKNEQGIPAVKIRLAVMVFFFVSGFVYANWASSIPHLQQKLHLTDAALGTLLISLPAGLMLTMPLSAWLIGKYKSRNIVLGGAILYVLLLSCIGFANEVWQMAMVLFAFGASRNLFNISINTQSIGVQQLYQKSIIASFHGVWSIASLVGAAFASILISLGVMPEFRLVLVTGLSLVLIVIFWGNTLETSANADAKKPAFALPDKSLLNLGLIAFCCMLCEGTMSDWSGIYLSKELHLSKGYVNMGYVAYLGCMTSGRLLGDWLANQLGNKKLLLISSLLLGLGALLIASFHSLIPAILGFMFCGFGVSCVVPFLFSHAGKSASMSSGVAIAAVSTIGYLGFLIGPPLVGFLSSAIGLRYTYFLVVTLAGVMGVLIGRIKMEQGLN
ncbi:MAG: MFS transporter [Chitinophagaceae bacterium BSSC1]|nr:MAG: MFS transporter [Chitinophagaceae bacterium BSSC1]